MAGTAPRSPEQFRNPDYTQYIADDFTVSELVSEAAGAHSPYGETEFPLPVEQLRYAHPEAADRPNLADGR